MGMVILVVLAVLLVALVYGVMRVNAFRPAVSADEVHMVTTLDQWQIRLCRYKAASGNGEPILLCHGFMSNQFNFTIPAGDAMVNFLAREGYDCWAIDLRGTASSVPASGHSRTEPSVDDHLLYDIPAALRYIQQTTGYPKVHWIGHSMGGMLLYAYDAVFGDDGIASAVTLGSPLVADHVGFRRPSFLLFIRQCSTSLFRFCQRILVDLLFRFHPTHSILPVNWANMDPRLDARALFCAIEIPPLPQAEDLIKTMEEHAWRVNGGKAEVFSHFPKLQTPLFAIFGGSDPFVPLTASETVFASIKSTDKRYLLASKTNGFVADYSHVDLVMGKEAPREIFTPVLEWLKAHPISQTHRVEKSEQETDFLEEPIVYASSARVTHAAEEAGEAVEVFLAESAAPRNSTKSRVTRSTTKKTAAITTEAVAARKPAARKATAASAKKSAAKKAVPAKKTSAVKKTPISEAKSAAETVLMNTASSSETIEAEAVPSPIALPRKAAIKKPAAKKVATKKTSSATKKTASVSKTPRAHTLAEADAMALEEKPEFETKVEPPAEDSGI